MLNSAVVAVAFLFAMSLAARESRLIAATQINGGVSQPVSVSDTPEQEPPSLFRRWGRCLAGDFPLKKSWSLNYGQSYDPNNRHDFLLVSFQWRWKYEDFWVHKAPDSLYLRLEAAGGMRIKTEERGVISCGMFGQRYLTSLGTESFRPYVDGGIGIIYTDFQNKDQGTRVNFNPRLSLGTDIHTRTGDVWFIALRLHHLSNAGLHKDNRGVNSALIVVGRYF